MKAEKYCISIDWLEVCCYCNLFPTGEYKSTGRRFVVKEVDQQTPMFLSLYEVYEHGLRIATIRRNPRSPKLNRGLTLMKMENRVLYATNAIETLYLLLRLFKFSYKGITRLDLCYDCNKFFGGRKPAKFVNDYVLKPLDEKGGMYRRGNDEFHIVGGRKPSYSKSKITSIRFGSFNSKIGAYMYDKTLELQEVKDKPWIRQMWEENGLISDEKHHVWRAEISIKCEGQDILNINTGELFRLSPKYVEHYENLVKIFHYYAAKVFDFRVNNGQKKRANFPSVCLFDPMVTITCKPIRMSRAADTGRMEKICYNKLERLSTTYTDLSEPIRQSLNVAMDFLLHLSGVKLSITRQNEYKRYLDTLKAYKFFGQLDYLYFEALEQARESRESISAEYVYDLYCKACQVQASNT